MLIRCSLRQRCLFNRQEWPDLIATWADRPDDCGNRQQNDIRGQREYHPGKDHQTCPNDQHLPPSDTIRDARDPQRDHCIADQSQ